MYGIPNLTFHNLTKVDYEMVRVDQSLTWPRASLNSSVFGSLIGLLNLVIVVMMVRMRRMMKVNFDSDDKDKSEV